MASIQFPDNEPCLQLISGRGGVFALLDEQCALGQGSDAQFLDRLVAEHDGHPFFHKEKRARTAFVVRHYAGDVSYETEGFREKNKDTLKDSLKVLQSNLSV